jgi:2-polyprenyl-3-methyl-5-hydroxy-6-metoxy-1,4-benzoquinol methylase
MEPTLEPSQSVIVRYGTLSEPSMPRSELTLDIGCGNHPNEEADVKLDLFRGKANFVADAHKLPFKSGAFSKIIMHEVIEHLDSPKQVLREIHRVLKSRGALEISTPNTMFVGDYFWWITNPDKGVHRDHIWGWRLPELKNLLNLSNFRVTKVSFVDHERFWRPARLARIFLLSRLTKHHVLVQASRK